MPYFLAVRWSRLPQRTSSHTVRMSISVHFITNQLLIGVKKMERIGIEMAEKCAFI